MRFQHAKFLTSCYDLSSAPEDSGAELLFLGRSNVGKSSVINRICAQKILARTSKTPGRTQCLNIFSLGEGARLIDAPGYGFAKVPEHVKRQWHELIFSYCRSRRCLKAIVIVMDIRHPLQPYDREWLDFVETFGLPLVLVLNKQDCLGRMQQKKAYVQVDQYCRARSLHANILLVSCKKNLGIDSMRDVLSNLIWS